MPTNIEIKARVRELDRIRSLAESIATEPSQIFHQEDVFFQTGKGRLKLRILSDTTGELIYYERPNTSGAKLSSYQIYETSKPYKLRQLLSTSLGETITVKKKREVYKVGQTRIHLDEVDELGTFIELEVVLGPDQAPEDGRTIASELMKKLGINETDLVSGAYADILLTRAEQGVGADVENTAAHFDVTHKKMKPYLRNIDTETRGNRYDVTPLFLNHDDFNSLVTDLISGFIRVEIDCVGCIDSLGFILGTAIAQKLGVGIVPIRKGGKLPIATESKTFCDYTGQIKTLEIRQDILTPGAHVLIVDEWIETGAQVSAAIDLIEGKQAIVVGIATINMDDNECTRSIRSRYKVKSVWENSV